MKTFGETICICGILIFKLMLSALADDGLNEGDIKKIYKLKGGTVDATNYKIMKGGHSSPKTEKIPNPGFIFTKLILETLSNIAFIAISFKGEIIKESTKKIWMKVEKSDSKKKTGLMHKLSMSKSGSGKKSETNPTVSHVSREIEVFKDLKKGKKELLGEYVVDMLNYGTYDKKTVLIMPSLGKNLKEYSSKPYSWDDLSIMGPCMIKALRLLHERQYVHRSLKPEVFAFGTEQKVAPLKNKVYLFDVGLSEKYIHPNGSHKAYETVYEFVAETTFASTSALYNKTQSRRDDIESLYYLLTYLAGVTEPFEAKDLSKLHKDKYDFCFELLYALSLFRKSKIADVRATHAFFDFADDLGELFKSGHEAEPDYDDFISCFVQGLSEKGIKDKYSFVALDKFENKSACSSIGLGNTTSDPNNKTEVIMKLLKTSPSQHVVQIQQSFKIETRVYNDMKKGTKHSLLRENLCDMLDHGVYDNRRVIVMPRLGPNWLEHTLQNYAENIYPFEILCREARQAISAVRFVHKKGYLHQDIKLDNFAFGTVEANKSDKSQADKPLKTRLYLFDFGFATKWKLANKTHKLRRYTGEKLGSVSYMCRTTLQGYSQSRRDDMESLFLTLATAAASSLIFQPEDDDDEKQMWDVRNEFLTKPGVIVNTFREYGVEDRRTHKAFTSYASLLNKLFSSDEPAYFEKEPDYNAFCVCFGGKPGNNACAVE